MAGYAQAPNELRCAVAYLRISFAANVGADKNSEKRQRAAIETYAKRAGFQIVDSYYDEAVSSADHVTAQPGFAATIERIADDGIRTIIVETANRFARDLMVQEVGCAMLKGRSIELLAADKPDAFLDDTPTANLIRQVLGSISEFEKAMVVTKLRGARQRKRSTGLEVAGRKIYLELRPDAVALATRYTVTQSSASVRRCVRYRWRWRSRGTSQAPASPTLSNC